MAEFMSPANGALQIVNTHFSYLVHCQDQNVNESEICLGRKLIVGLGEADAQSMESQSSPR